jgi:hypothetical protein
MRPFQSLLQDEDSEVEAINAFCFSDEHFYVLLQVTNEKGPRASALLRVPSNAPEDFEILDEHDRKTVAYWSPGPASHFVQASGRELRVVAAGSRTIRSFAAYETSLMHMAGTPEGSVVLYGDGGLALHYRNGAFVPLATGLDANLHAMDVNPAGLAAVGGNFGAFAIGPLGDLATRDLGLGDRILKLRVRRDGSVAIALDASPACELRDDELIPFDEHEAVWCSIQEYRGEEIWGDDAYGVHVRRGTTFLPVLETEYAFDINRSGEILTVNSAFAIRIFSGRGWRSFRVQRDPDAPLVEAALDFDPIWPT